MSIMPYPPGQDPRDAILSRPQPDWPDEEPDPDAVVDDLRWRWRRGSFPPPVLGFDLSGGVGRGTRNARADVARLETLLHRAGHYDVSGTGGPTGYFGPPQEDAIRAYQKARGLTVDGLVLPNGETMPALAREPEAPPPDGQPEADEDAGQEAGNRAPRDQVALAAPAVGAAVIVGTALVGSQLWQQEQERQRKAGAPPRGINLLDGLKRLSPEAGNGVTKAGPLPWQWPGFDPPDMNLPNHTGAPPPKLPDTSILSGPGTPMPVEQVPPTIRPDLKREDFVEIFPDQSGDLPQLIVNEANQNPQTKQRITDLGDRFKKAGGPNTKVIAGGYDEFGQYRRERALLDKTQKGTKGAVFADTIVYDPDLDITIYIQDADAYVDGERLKPHETDAAGRMFKLAPPRRFVVTFPKPRPGQALNEEAADKFIRDVWAKARAEVEQAQPEHGNIYNPRQSPLE